MGNETDRRMWSTTPKRLSEFVGALLRAGIPSTSVRNLQLGFREHGVYPARDFPQFCVPGPPDAFFSYHSAQNFVDIQEIVWQTFDFAARELRNHRPDLAQTDLEPMISDGVRLWVDFMFIDQSARDLREELNVLPQLLQGARAHFVLGSRPLTRAWCCYEIALFNQRLAGMDAPTMPGQKGALLRSYVAPSRYIYHGWELTETSESQDKTFIAERVSAAFPGGFEGFNHIMQQANATAVLSLTEGSPWTPPAAEDNLRKAVEAWYARSLSTSQ